MRTYLLVFAIAMVVTLILTPLVRRLAPSVGAVDLPSGRRVNKRVLPRLGGFAIFAGFLAPLVGLFFYDNDVSLEFREGYFRAAALFGGALVLVVLGALDDLRGLRAWLKLLVQIAVAVAAYYSGFRIDEINLPLAGQLEMGVFALPVTVLWIVGIVNAVNLVDGLDGLAAGVAFFACVVGFVVGVISDYVLGCLFSVALGGALLGFLVFNFNPATIFMGDSGSMFIGFVLATSGLVGSKGSTAVALLVPVLALGLPIMDTLFAIARRVIGRRPIFSPDQEHIHHRLLDMGFTHRRAVILLYGVSMLFTLAAIVVYLGRTDWQVGMALLVATVVVVGMIRAVSSFQARRIRQAQRESRYPEDAERLRTELPTLLLKLSEVDDPTRVGEVLKGFAARSKLVFMECNNGAGSALGDLSWEADRRGSGASKRGEKDQLISVRCYVSATYTIVVNPGRTAKLKFGWYAASGDVSPQSEVLLRLVADATERRLIELDCEGSGERVTE